jgi:RNA polymerase I specific transcription initiation factor RRN3
VLSLIVGKCLEIDVEIVIEDSGAVKIQEEYRGEVRVLLCFECPGRWAHFGLFCPVGGVGRSQVEDIYVGMGDSGDVTAGASASSSSSSSGSGKAATQRIYSEGAQRISDDVADSADKLDGMLMLVINFVQARIDRGGDALNRLAQHLLVIFEDRILLTHRSKFVQFVMFYCASRVPRFRDAFGAALLQLFLDESAAHLRRQSAILYLASYLARANFLSPAAVADVLTSLMAWAEAYVAQRERDGRDDGTEAVEVDEFGRLQTATESVVSRHETFFSCVQAACYVLCFYGVDAATQQKHAPAARRRWERVIGSRMQPLRYCLQSVRVEFFRLADHVGLLGPAVWAAIPADLLPPGMHAIHAQALAAQVDRALSRPPICTLSRPI